MKKQGTVVVERQGIMDGGGYLVMTPDGAIGHRATRAGALKLAQAWFKANLNGAKVGIGEIEWR